MEYSKREKEISLELAIDVMGAIWYFGALFSGRATDAMALGAVVVQIIVAAILVSIIATIYVNKQHGDEPVDERDWAIDARAFKIGYYVLVTFSCILAGQIFIDTLDIFGGRQLNIASDTFILANIILGMVVLSFITKAAVQLILYRRGGPDQ